MGQSFMMKRSQSFASYRIHKATFGIRRFTDRGSGDSLVDSIITHLRRPVSVGSEGPKGRLKSMGRLLLTKHQGLFRLSKIEL
jgi:hypothetical protein